MTRLLIVQSFWLFANTLIGPMIEMHHANFTLDYKIKISPLFIMLMSIAANETNEK